MPAQESVRKQTSWGGAAGILLLAFALVYRFFPGLIHVTPLQHAPVGSIRPTLPPLVGVPRTPEFVGPPEEEIGPPRELAGVPPAPVPLAPAEPEKPAAPSITSLLAQADKAVAEGHHTDTGEDSALAIYKQVLAEDRNNRKAKAGMQAVTTALLDQAREALDRGDAEEADTALSALEGVPHSKEQFAALLERF